jgi:hypothetical protein
MTLEDLHKAIADAELEHVCNCLALESAREIYVEAAGAKILSERKLNDLKRALVVTGGRAA